MKRLWSTPEYIRRQRRRQKKAERRVPPEDRGTGRLHVRARRVELVAPHSLCLFEDPDATIAFCNDIRKALARPHTQVRIDLEGLEKLSGDGMLLMRAVMQTRARRCGTGGNMPSDPKVAAQLKESGFFTGFARAPKDLPPATGMMLSASSRRVYSRMAADLVRFAMRNATMSDDVASASSQMLVEAMTNTHAHAAGLDRGPKNYRRGSAKYVWYAGVYCAKGMAHFTFVDLGVGLLRGADARHFLRKMGIAADTYGRATLFRDLFTGVVGSATGIPGRGRGLPEMRMCAQQGTLAKLEVMTSSIVGEIATLKCTDISVPIRGTIYRWQSA